LPAGDVLALMVAPITETKEFPPLSHCNGQHGALVAIKQHRLSHLGLKSFFSLRPDICAMAAVIRRDQ
jgi:hypothetical protein